MTEKEFDAATLKKQRVWLKSPERQLPNELGHKPTTGAKGRRGGGAAADDRPPGTAVVEAGSEDEDHGPGC